MLNQDAESQLRCGVWPPEAGQAHGSAYPWDVEDGSWRGGGEGGEGGGAAQ